MTPELAEEIRRYPAVFGEDRILPPEAGATSGRQRADKSFANLLKRAKIRNFRFRDLRHTVASWYMMCGGDLYELSRLLGHSNINMTERYAELAQKHIMKTGSVSRENLEQAGIGQRSGGGSSGNERRTNFQSRMRPYCVRDAI
jgi:integrase